MTFRHKALATTVAFVLAGLTAAEPAGAASVNAQFSAAVARILNSIRGAQPALAEMSSSEFNAFVSCAQNVMNDAPVARKQYVLAAPNINVQRQRFDEVALDNRAALKQRITRECYY